MVVTPSLHPRFSYSTCHLGFQRSRTGAEQCPECFCPCFCAQACSHGKNDPPQARAPRRRFTSSLPLGHWSASSSSPWCHCNPSTFRTSSFIIRLNLCRVLSFSWLLGDTTERACGEAMILNIHCCSH